MESLTPKNLGALMIQFILETLAAAHLLEIDPFDQPAVEAGKKLALKYLND
jgi:glucose-6-phosphate isomerase